MKPSQLPWRWLLLGAIAVSLIGVATAPWLFSDRSRFADAVASRLSEWSGGQARFTGPVKVSIFPEISVRGPLELTGSGRLPFLRKIEIREAKASLDLPSLLRGKVAIDVLRIVRPKIYLNETFPAAAAAPENVSRLLSHLPVRALSIRNGKLYQGVQPIKGIHANVDAGQENGGLTIRGGFSYDKERVRFAVESGAPSVSETSERVPVAISVSSTLLRGKLNGTASFGGAFELDGGVEARIEDVRRFLRWVGYEVPEGNGLKALDLAGTLHFGGATFAVDEGVFTLDGNRAIGVLAFSANARPRIEGTFAFDQLPLDPYLGSRGEVATSASTLVAEPPLDWLFRHLDADLRISASAISAASYELGSGGITVTARNGSVTGEVGEVELCGGRASGRVDLGLAPGAAALDITASMREVALQPCLAPLSLGEMLRGVGDLSIKVSTKGWSDSDLLENLGGNLKLTARAGAVPLDFPRLLAATTPVEVSGWRDGGSTGFDELHADCTLAAGKLQCQSLNLRAGEESLAVAGDIDLPKASLNWSVSQSDIDLPSDVSMPRSKTKPALSIRGPLSQPSIRRTDRAAVGEGVDRGRKSNEVQPH